MNYFSTRDSALRRTASQTILQGIAPDGGLFVPQEIPSVDLTELIGLDYCALAAKILGLYLTDYSEEFLAAATKKAYGGGRFGDLPAKVVRLEDGLFSMELWHGPTCAFKDYALQLMPLLLTEAKRINGDDSKTAILVATSGDTGKAALEGYRDLDGIEIAVFYPDHGTSEMQRLQMATQEGSNVHVFAVRGNFDDAQTGVKKVFTDAAFAAACAAQNKHLTSANSINWGRLVPQIVYYFAGYFQLVRSGAIKLGDPVQFCVPTGNFGDILAGYYAKRMGLRVSRLLCASNKNRVLADFGASGSYDANRPFTRPPLPRWTSLSPRTSSGCSAMRAKAVPRPPALCSRLRRTKSIPFQPHCLSGFTKPSGLATPMRMPVLMRFGQPGKKITISPTHTPRSRSLLRGKRGTMRPLASSSLPPAPTSSRVRCSQRSAAANRGATLQICVHLSPAPVSRRPMCCARCRTNRSVQ